MSDLDRVIFALDVPSFADAKTWVEKTSSKVSHYKVGSILYTSAGPDVVKMIHDHGARVFLDLKFFDIPHTVAKSCEVAAKMGVFLVDVHARGGSEMLSQAVKAVRGVNQTTKIIGVTVLTSDAQEANTEATVLNLASACKSAGLDGAVCSVQEVEKVRQSLGKDFVLVTPGIRWSSSKKDDQKRTDSPSAALKKGASYLVIGRPILESKDPLKTLDEIADELA